MRVKEQIANAAARTKKFVRDLQKSDEKRKRRWFFSGTVFSFIIVLGLWTMFLQTSIKQSGANESDPATTSIYGLAETKNGNPPDKYPSFFGTVADGAKEVWNEVSGQYNLFSEKIGGGFLSLKTSLERKNVIEIERKEEYFIPQSLESAPPTQLP